METDLIDGYLRHLREINRAATTITSRRQMLHRLDRELRELQRKSGEQPRGLEGANEDELRIVIYRDDIWTPRTQAAHLAAICSWFEWACRPSRAILDFNPTTELMRPRFHEGLPRPVDDQVLEDILRRAAEPYRLYVLLAAYGSFRSCEIAWNDRERITEASMLILGKGGKERVVPTHPLIWEVVKDLPAGPLARRTRDPRRRTTPHRVSRDSAGHFDKLGHEGVTLHQMRHWFGTKTLEACGNLRVVQELMGHSSPNSTAIYTKVLSKARSEAVAALPQLA